MTWEIFIYAVGPLCQLRETAASENIRQRCSALPQYIATLREAPGTLCSPGQPGTLVWVPDENTPDTVYYQVIHVPHQPFLRGKSQTILFNWGSFKGYTVKKKLEVDLTPKNVISMNWVANEIHFVIACLCQKGVGGTLAIFMCYWMESEKYLCTTG